MFNVSKKTLSLVLCLTLIASVVVFCFAGSASAVTTVKYPTYDSVKSLAAESKSSLVVDLDFEGANRYGLPLNRGNHVFYDTPGFVTVKNGGGWAFIGKTGEALKNASGADLGGTVYRTHADAAYVVGRYLYEFKAGMKYQLVMDYKFLAGSKITNTRTVGLAMYQNPHQPASGVETPLKEVKISSAISGNKAVWNVDGVAQTGEVLEKDTDIQTMTATFLPEADGYLAVRTHDGDTTDATLAIDSIKIYSDSGLGDTYQNPIAFDDGGVVISRYIDGVGYATEENGNGYFAFDGTGGSSTGSIYFANSEYGKTILSKDQAAADSSINDKMFKFLPGHSYEVTFRFRIAENANNNVTLGSTQLQPRLAKAPAGAAHGYDDLYGTNTWAKDIIFSGITVQAIGVWQDAKITFTVKTPEESEAGFTGAYFGFRGAGLATHIDDYNVRELINYSVKTFDARNVSLDFTGATTSSLGVTTAGANVTIETDDNTGNNYMKVASTGNARISMNETRVLKRDKKYYISFDAMTEDGCADFNFVMGNPGSKSANFRIFFNDIKGALDTSGSKFYIDGQEVNGYANFTPNGEWRHYGFTLNLDSATWNGKGSGAHTVGCDSWISLENGGGVYLLFGAGQTSGKSVCYDNIKISQFDEIKDAVPATDGKVDRETSTYFNDFNSITTSNLTQNSADTAKVEEDASAPERGDIIKILSGGSRLTVNDTNVFEAGYKYTISFDAKLDPDSATATSRMYAIFAPINSLHSPRYFIMDTGSGCTNPDVLGAFKFYIDGQESTWKDFAIDKNWKTYTIEFDYTNESFLAAASPESTDDQMKGLSNAVSYFHFGCANGWFDNLKIVKSSKVELKDNTQVSRRQASGSGENYVSAGLRFKNSLPNDVVAAADEIGFVVIPSSMAVTAPDTWYKMDGTGSASAQTVVCKNATMNQMYERTASETYYQLVLTGLSTESGKTAYNRRFSAVLYVKNGDTYTYHALGETSYNQVGAIKDVINAQ